MDNPIDLIASGVRGLAVRFATIEERIAALEAAAPGPAPAPQPPDQPEPSEPEEPTGNGAAAFKLREGKWANDDLSIEWDGTSVRTSDGLEVSLSPSSGVRRVVDHWTQTVNMYQVKEAMLVDQAHFRITDRAKARGSAFKDGNTNTVLFFQPDIEATIYAFIGTVKNIASIGGRYVTSGAHPDDEESTFRVHGVENAIFAGNTFVELGVSPAGIKPGFRAYSNGTGQLWSVMNTYIGGRVVIGTQYTRTSGPQPFASVLMYGDRIAHQEGPVISGAPLEICAHRFELRNCHITSPYDNIWVDADSEGFVRNTTLNGHLIKYAHIAAGAGRKVMLDDLLRGHERTERH